MTFTTIKKIFLEETIKTEFKRVVVYKEGWGRIREEVQKREGMCVYT